MPKTAITEDHIMKSREVLDLPRQKPNVLLALLILLLVALVSGCDKKYEAWGVVRELTGQGISGVEMVFSGESHISSVTTKSNGEWSKGGLKGPAYVTPRKTGYTFTPQYARLPVNGSVNFTATYAISGLVVDGDNNRIGMDGVFLQFDRDYGFALTDEQGRWTISGLSGAVRVTPHHREYVFRPASLTVTNPNSPSTFVAEKKQKRIDVREIEPNNEWDWANVISTNETYIGQMATAEDIDFYRFTLHAPGSIVIKIGLALFDLGCESWHMALFDETGAAFSGPDIYSFASCGDEPYSNSPTIRLPADDYYVRITPREFMGNDYRLCIAYSEEGGVFEKEFNDTMATATRIDVGAQYTGNLYRQEDVDYYKFSLPEPGSIVVQFSHEFFDDCRETWHIVLIDEGLTDPIYSFASCGNEEDTNSPKIRLPAGDYYVKIAPDVHCFHDMDYDLCVTYSEEGEFFEKEFNDTIATATRIDVGAEYTGNLYRREDVDYYEFTLDEPGGIVIRFGHALLDDGLECWNIALLDEGGTDPTYFFASRGNEETIVTPTIRLPAGKYYVRVTASTFGFQHIDCNLHVSYSPEGESFEREFNDTFATAMPIEANVSHTGNLYRCTDVDYYRFTLHEASNIVIRFGHEPFDDSREFWLIALFDEAGDDPICSFPSRGTEADRDSLVMPLPEGDYYIRVARHPYYFHYMDYDIGVHILE